MPGTAGPIGICCLWDSHKGLQEGQRGGCVPRSRGRGADSAAIWRALGLHRRQELFEDMACERQRLVGVLSIYLGFHFTNARLHTSLHGWKINRPQKTYILDVTKLKQREVKKPVIASSISRVPGWSFSTLSYHVFNLHRATLSDYPSIIHHTSYLHYTYMHYTCMHTYIHTCIHIC